MKQGWEIKKLGEVCTIERGGSPRPIDAYITDEDNGINWIKIGDATLNSRYITSTKEKIKPEGVRKSRKVYKGDFILSNSMSFGRPYILDIDGCIHDGWLVLRDKENIFDKIFLYYYLSSPFIYQEFKRLAVGGVVNNLNSELVRGVNVFVPPIAEQEKIVAELDCLSGIIEKKKQQLKELDNLAQSLFYEMFGDPVENDKGWETKKVIEVVKLQRGYDLPIQHRQSDGGIPVWGSNGIVGWHNEAKVDYGVITGRSGTLGTVYSYDKPFFPLNTTLFSVETHGNDIVYLKYLLNIFDLKRFGTGTGVPTLNRNVFHSEPIISVPLALQQDFASKIESIEKQKELIAQSIKETETLFNSRMDYYFN